MRCQNTGGWIVPRFKYLADPVCIGSVVVYLVNRIWLKPSGISGTFGSCYLNDMLCLPLFLPMILWLQRRMGLRVHDGPPRVWEVLQHWAIFSILVEVLLPRFPQYFRTVADPMDVVAYLVGGMMGWMWWRTGKIMPTEKITADKAVAHEECSHPILSA